MGLAQSLGPIDNRVEGLRIGDGDFAEHFSIQRDVGVFQATDESAVVDSALATGGADARNPQPPIISLDIASVTVGEGAGADN